MLGIRFNPEPGKVYKHRCGPSLQCLYNSEAEQYCALMRNIKTGWQITAHGLTLYPDGKIEWEYSTGGRFVWMEGGEVDVHELKANCPDVPSGERP